MTPEEKKKVEEARRKDNLDDLTDEEVLAKLRFLEDGEGLQVFNNAEEWKAWKEKNRDTINEV